MTTRIDTRFAELAKEGRAAFVTFVMCGDPDLATSLEIIKALPINGTVNPANGGTKYTPGPELTRTLKHIRNM